MRATPSVLLSLFVLTSACHDAGGIAKDLASCGAEIVDGVRPIATDRATRFLGKVQATTARCRGGANALTYRETPWTDWSNYWATGDASSRSLWWTRNSRGVNGSLIDLEYERVELIRFNLFDNSGTFADYINGRGGSDGPALRVWKEMRLPPGHPNFADVGGDAAQQRCTGNLIRFRTLTGICNDIQNPLMGSTGMLFARNVDFENTFPDAGLDEITRNRHGGRLSLLSPDPQVISRKLFTRAQSDSNACNGGYGKPNYSKTANCDYKKASDFNVLAAFWIQFMTHDWFSHLEEGHNSSTYMAVGCHSERVNGVVQALDSLEAQRLGCRPSDQMERVEVADSTTPTTFEHEGRRYLTRAPRTFRNTNTAWWDASQIYGYDDRSRTRVKRDPRDPARLLMIPLEGAEPSGATQGYLSVLLPTDPQNPDWKGQEATGFPDNWSVGLSFYHNVFAREHNQFVDAFRAYAATHPDEDSGLRDPAEPERPIPYRAVTPDVLFEVARLVVAAEIAKIHTIEWTTQLLYNESLYRGMNSNWSGLIKGKDPIRTLLTEVVDKLHRSNAAVKSNMWYSILASGPGITGTGNKMLLPHPEDWSIASEQDVNGGTNHFGSPFNFPEEFVTVYRLHTLLPDLLEFRDIRNPDTIALKIPVVETFRGHATSFMHDHGIADWALTMGRQRLAQLTLQNQPMFLQNLKMDRLHSPTQRIDVAALDIIRDRERGVPRFNEFRRQYGLRQLTSFDDFIDIHPSVSAADHREQVALAAKLREVYGQHVCDASKVITHTQLMPDGGAVNDCLGHKNGSLVDNIEDLDTVVGWLAESTRPHGYAISETQFVVFILNASRRLYSDRFLTSSFRPEIYSTLGYRWVNDNGPEPMIDARTSNGHSGDPVSPMKRVLLRTIPELKPELEQVVNAFDPWARDRGTYYSLEWKPRAGAEHDEAFAKP
jgi:hypothetical protein